MSLEMFAAALMGLQEKRILVLGHEDADCDAIGAAYAIARLLPRAVIGAPSISCHAKSLVECLGVKLVIRPSASDYDVCVVVDTASGRRLPGIVLAEYLLIDHHETSELISGAQASLWAHTDSTCSLVYRLYRFLGIKLDASVSLALAAGLVSDTVRLSKASAHGIVELGEILQAGQVKYAEVLEVLRPSYDTERLQRLRALNNCDIHELGAGILAVASVEQPYLYYTSSMLLELGADLALVISSTGGITELRLAKARSSGLAISAAAVLTEALVGRSVLDLWGSEYFASFKGLSDPDATKRLIIECLYAKESQ